jgi:drug/metabolite transporter (DMT)-like permease
MSRLRADLWLVLITVIWGSTFVIVKSSLDSVGPHVFVASRFWTAGLVLLPVLLARRVRRTPNLLRDGVLTGLFLTAGFLTQTIGLQTTDAGKAAFITGLNVVLVPVFATFILRHIPAPHAIGGVMLATVGLGFMTLDRSLTLQSGDLWVLACAVAFALHIIAIARFSPRHDVLPFTLVQLFTVATVASAAALLFEREALAPPLATIPSILYMGLIATAFVFALQTWVQRYTTPTHTALIFALEPVTAAFFAVMFAGEWLATREWVGGGLILLGMLAAELGDLVWRRKPEQQLVGSLPSGPE